MFSLTESIKNQIKNANGRRKVRTLSENDIEQFIAKLNEVTEDESVRTLRVYAGQGFVPNSYKYRADITYIEANRNGDTFNIHVSTTDAKRPHGNGSLMTINGRACD